MSIRNKRLLIEKQRLNLNLNNIIWPNDADLLKDTICIKLKLVHENKNILLEMKLHLNYPFICPKMYIQNIDYIQWILNKKSKYNHLINLFNLNIPCICCNTITCLWSPANGIKEMIQEFDTYYYYFYILEKFNIIYNKIKIDGFDDLIYSKIIHFLYLSNI